MRNVVIDALAPLLVAALVWKAFPRPARTVFPASFRTANLRGSDNRVWMGPTFLVLVCTQAMVQALAVSDRMTDRYAEPAAVLASAAVLGGWVVTAAASACQLFSYLVSRRTRHYGLFAHWIMGFVSADLCAGLIQGYFQLFVRSRWTVPMWGNGLPREAALLYVRVGLSAAATVLLLTVRRLPRTGPAIAIPEPEPLIDEPVGLEQQQRRQFSTDSVDMQQSPEIGNSILGNLFFTWSYTFIRFGERHHKQPEIEDLYLPLEKHTMAAASDRYTARASPQSSLMWNLVKTFRAELLLQLVLSPTVVVFDLLQPLLMQMLLHFIEQYQQDTSISLRFGYLLATGMLCAGISAEVVQQQQLWQSRLLNIDVRNVLVSMLTQKTILRRTTGATRSADGSYGANDPSEGRAHNVLTADISGIAKLSSLILSIVKAPARLILGGYYMYRLLGLSGVLGMVMVAMVMALTHRLVAHAKRIEKSLGVINDRRLEAINEIVRGISSIKLFGWNSRFTELVGETRAKQLVMLWKRAKVWSFITLFTLGSLPFVIFAILATYGAQHSLTAETIFTAIAVFKIVQRAIQSLPFMVSQGLVFYVSLRRIEAYLKQQEAQPLDDRISDISNDCELGFDGATLMWGAEASFALNQLSTRFPAGKLSLVGGPTASGKSSLLAALVGEMDLVEGRIQVPTAVSADIHTFGGTNRRVLSNIAYVSQVSWLRNATIRANILFGEPFQQQRYDKVLYMCALRPDLHILPAGDLTEIGERGITLSGGQRQRVALARAIYSSRKILLIDDCLSAVDAHTARHILHKCLLSTNELMEGRTRVLVTHHLALCMQHCDYVVMMRDGAVEFQGTRQEALQDPSIRQGGSLDSTDEEDLDEATTDAEFGTETPSAAPSIQSSTQAFAAAESGVSTSGRLVQAEERNKGMVKMDTWQTYFKPCGGWSFAAVCIACIALMQFFVMYKDYYLAKKLDTETSAHIQQWLVAYLGFGVLSAVLGSLALLLAYVGSLRASATIHAHLLTSIVNAMPRFLNTTPVGRIMTRFAKDMRVIDEDIMEILFECLRSVLALFITMGTITLTIPSFSAVGLVILGVYIRLTWQFTQAQRECKRLEAVTFAPIVSLYSEIIPGCDSIRAFDAQDAFMREMEYRFSVYLSADIAMRSTRNWLGIRISMASALVSYIAALFILAHISEISSGLAGFIILYTVYFSAESLVVARKYSDLELSLNCVERVGQYLNADQEAPSRTAADDYLAVGWPNSGELVIKNLVAGYTADTPVLHGLSVSIGHGEKVGVVGFTGAGKSSLSLALLRLIEASS
ncbi:hypothetical protein GGF46_004655, partial [Coemansia sp. RSA 552]